MAPPTDGAVSAFHSLGLPDADELLVRADLMLAVTEILRSRGLSQGEAGKLIGLDQPRVSDLLNGKITRFSTDRLLQVLSDLGQDVEIRISAAVGPRGKLKVAA